MIALLFIGFAIISVCIIAAALVLRDIGRG